MKDSSIPIGGFLYLLAVGLLASPIPLVKELYFFLTVLVSDSYRMLSGSLQSIIAYSTLADLLMLGYLAVLIVTFFKKKTTFPVHLIRFLLLSILISAIDVALTLSGLVSDTKIQLLLLACVIDITKAGILIPYVRLSKRVRRTFTN